MTGCPSDDSPPVGSESSSSSADGTTTNTTPGTTTMPTNVDTTAGASSGEPDPTTGEPDPTTGEPDPTTGDPTGGSMACEPDPMDDECAACIKDMCCMQLEVCLADGDATTGCVCFQECVQAGGNPIGECDSMCMVSPLDGGTPTGQIGSCTLASCGICLAG